MHGARKTLTLCYGSLSCSLEGFAGPFNAIDDPASTMEALAKYFGTLAAEARSGAAGQPAGSPMPSGGARVMPSHLAGDAEATIERLIAQANTAMEVPENKRRVSAIAHLKAAVATTLAESFGARASDIGKFEREEPYRGDLKRMVRPSPSAQKGRVGVAAMPEPRQGDPTSGEGRPPLRLSSGEPQVSDEFDGGDLPAAVPGRMPQPPLAIAAGASIAPIVRRSFADFAERLRATSPADLLEAAAAYSACVEGRPHFSRPQVLRQVIAIIGAEISREDHLRSFGRLLREGRIVRVRRGQFTLTDRSRLLVEARKILG